MTPSDIDAMLEAKLTPEQMAILLKRELEKQQQAIIERREKAAERQRRSRASRNVTVTERDSREQDVTPPALKDPLPNLVTVEVNPNPPPYSPPALEKSDLGFGEVWAAYPRRLGTNSRKNAEARYRAAVKSGSDPETILDGVRRYAAQCDATGKTGTEFVKAAEAWLNGRLWECSYEINAPSRPPPFAKPNGRQQLLDALDRVIPDEQPRHYPRLAG